ncbi:unnamed protein product, partial [Trichogramma brassicae]
MQGRLEKTLLSTREDGQTSLAKINRKDKGNVQVAEGVRECSLSPRTGGRESAGTKNANRRVVGKEQVITLPRGSSQDGEGHTHGNNPQPPRTTQISDPPHPDRGSRSGRNRSRPSPHRSQRIGREALRDTNTPLPLRDLKPKPKMMILTKNLLGASTRAATLNARVLPWSELVRAGSACAAPTPVFCFDSAARAGSGSSLCHVGAGSSNTTSASGSVTSPRKSFRPNMSACHTLSHSGPRGQRGQRLNEAQRLFEDWAESVVLSHLRLPPFASFAGLFFLSGEEVHRE